MPFDAAIAERAVLPGGAYQRTAVFADSVRRQLINVGRLIDQLDRIGVQLSAIGGEANIARPVSLPTTDVVLIANQRTDTVFFTAGVICGKTQVALALIICWRRKVQAQMISRGRCADSHSAPAENGYDSGMFTTRQNSHQ